VTRAMNGLPTTDLMDLERALDHLFPPPVVCRVATFSSMLRELGPEEQRCIPRAGDKRRQEFRAGRHAAHSALRALGHAPPEIVAAKNGAPIWPSGVVGSISHSGKLGDGWAVAAVAPRTHAAGLGVDLEAAAPLKDGLERRILTAPEAARLDQTVLSVALWGKVAFACKEATYKAQYPVTGTFLEFHDLELDLVIEPALIHGEERRGAFRALFQRSAGSFRQSDALFGRFVLSCEWVLAGVALPE
jgi:4'-phosphopantetheinyl transferase EntD